MSQKTIREKKERRKIISFLLIGFLMGSLAMFGVMQLFLNQAYANLALNDWKARPGDWAHMQAFYVDSNYEPPMDEVGANIFWYITEINITSVWHGGHGQWFNGSTLWGHTVDRQANGTIMDERIDWMGIYNDTTPFPFGLDYFGGEQGFFVSPKDIMAFYGFLAVLAPLGLGLNSSIMTVNTTHFIIDLWNGTASKEEIYDSDKYWKLTYNGTKNTLSRLQRFHWNTSTTVWDLTFLGEIIEWSWRNYDSLERVL